MKWWEQLFSRENPNLGHTFLNDWKTVTFPCRTCHTLLTCTDDGKKGFLLMCPNCKRVAYVPPNYKALTENKSFYIVSSEIVLIKYFMQWFSNHPLFSDYSNNQQQYILSATCALCGFELGTSEEDMKAFETGRCPKCLGTKYQVLLVEIPFVVKTNTQGRESCKCHRCNGKVRNSSGYIFYSYINFSDKKIPYVPGIKLLCNSCTHKIMTYDYWTYLTKKYSVQTDFIQLRTGEGPIEAIDIGIIAHLRTVLTPEEAKKLAKNYAELYWEHDDITQAEMVVHEVWEMTIKKWNESKG